VDQTIQKILADKRFYELLLGFDRQIADVAHAGRCQRCGTKLHCGSFVRKPRGVPVGLGPEHCARFSFCCAARDCRKRETPGSLRFLGRKVFLGAMVVLVTAMQSGLSAARARQLEALVGVSWRTVARWREWWCSIFTDSPFWRAHGAFVPPVTTADLPASLLKRFTGDIEQQLLSLLRFLRPITTGVGLMRALFSG
jgi:hypothetical protein